MAKGTERDEIAQFAARYAQGRVPAVLATERESVGSDYGATGYTTVAQADLLSDELGLGPGDRLLDIGSGCGWPGLHIAARTGCSVVVTDLTLPGVQRARDRAVLDAMGARAAVAVANGRQLPFRPESFDAVVVADVLC